MSIARFHSSLVQVPAAAWNALVADDNPFVDHAFLCGLEQHGCVKRELGWQPYHLGLYEGQKLVAAAPLYLKANSHGEYVFDWGWADAYARHGLSYYPKLLCAVPYSPVTGPRLLAGDGHEAGGRRIEMIEAIGAESQRLGLSSAHLNFACEADAAAFTATEWLPRFDWQFHWQNRGYRDFPDFLDALSSKNARISARNALALCTPACAAKCVAVAN